ncbi:MAG: YggS family pyridoxal phosphate-dependent enzyme [Planctomycetota bacterium]
MQTLESIKLDRKAATDKIAANWQTLLAEVDQATSVAGRSVGDVQVIGVSKYVDAEITGLLVDAGCRHLGENRPQVLCEKAESAEMVGRASWHQIGHLQRNKVRPTLRHVHMIHSVDSERLLQAIASEAVKQQRTVACLLEVNISGDANKTGLDVPSLERLLLEVPKSGVRVAGLMAMAGWGTEADAAQRQFAAVRELRDRMQAEFALPLPELSMGMSGDFQAAITEGSTMVRIGTRLFDGLW